VKKLFNQNGLEADQIAVMTKLSLDQVQGILNDLTNSTKTPLPGFTKLKQATQTEHDLYLVNAIKATLRLDPKNQPVVASQYLNKD
jgi:argininosuccinate lyase